LDEEAILDSVHKTRAVVVAEEHQRNGGLGDAIANLLVHKLPTPMEYVGVKDSFGESGKPVELLDKYGLSKNDVIWAIKDVLDRKS
jgi:transketolase